MTTVREDTLPEDLSTVVRDAAAALPPGGHQLARVAPRRQAQRRRTMTLSMAMAGVMAVAAAVTVPLVLRSAPEPDHAAGPASVPAQRIFAYGFGDGLAQGIRMPQRLADKTGAVAVRVPEGLIEITNSGPVVLHDNPDLNMMQDSVVGLPDGRVVAFGAWDRSNGATKPDGTAVMDMRYTLVVMDKDGKTTTKRDLGAANGTTRMPGVTGDAAYLLRGDRLVRHDLVTGTEVDVPAAARIRGYLAQQWELVAVGGGRAILEKDRDLNTVAKVVNLDGSGADSADLRVCGLICFRTSLARLSPDGRHIAHAYKNGKTETRLVVTDLTTGREVVGRDFSGIVQFSGPGLMGWADDDTLRLGVVEAPEKDGTYDLKDVLHVETINL